MIKDDTKVSGTLHVLVRDTTTGQIKYDVTFNNLVVSAGTAFIASRMSGAASGVMTYMAVGTGNTAPASGDVTLQTELARVALSVSGGTPTANAVLYTATFPAGTGTGALTEAGIFNASSGGTMLSRTTYAVVNKGASDEMIVNWTVTVG